MIDEADEAMPGQSSRKRSMSTSSSDGTPGSPVAKRKPGPLPKDMPYRGASPSSPSSSPSHSSPGSPVPSFDMEESTGQPPTGRFMNSTSLFKTCPKRPVMLLAYRLIGMLT